MMGRCCAAVLLLLVVGCGSAKKAPPPEPAETNEDAEPAMAMSAGDLELYYHAPGPTGEGARKPVFLLRAERFDFEPTAERYAFEKAHIEIAEDAEREAIVMDGARGHYEVGREASLEGGVTVQMGTTRIEVEDITYELPDAETAGSLHTDSPVVIESPERTLRATALRLEPDTKRFVLKNAKGRQTIGDTGP